MFSRFFTTLTTQWTGYQASTILAVLVLFVFTLVEWKYLELTTKIIAIVAFGLILTLLLLSQVSVVQLGMLCGSVTFFCVF